MKLRQRTSFFEGSTILPSGSQDLELGTKVWVLGCRAQELWSSNVFLSGARVVLVCFVDPYGV